MEKQQLSLVLPCYKPEPSWLEKVLNYYTVISERLPLTDIFLIIVNDGSSGMICPDHIEMLQDKIMNFSYYSYKKNMGKGYALRYGVARAQTSSVVYSDLDLPYTPDSFLKIANLLATHDVAIGIKNSNYYNDVPVWRKVISKFLQNLVAIFFSGIATTDTQCGLKGFKGKAKDIFLKTRINNYLFDLEFIVTVSKKEDISVAVQEIELDENVIFVPVSLKVIIRELINFSRIVFRKNRLF